MGDQEHAVGGAAPPPGPVGTAPPPPPPPPVAQAGEPRERRWLPTIAVLVVILVVSLGGYVAVGSVDEPFEGPGAPVETPDPSLPPVTVTGGITIRVLEGWQEAQRFSNPEGVRVTQGAGTLDVFAFPAYPGTAEDLWNDYVATFLQPQASTLESATILEPVAFPSGPTGVAGFYTGLFGDVNAPVEGELTAVIAPSGTGILFDGWAELGTYSFVADEVEAIVLTMEEA